MENKVLFRELKNSDIPALEDVVRKTWDYDKFATPKAAKRLAEAYLSTCLSDQTYTRVAEVNGIPAGLIFGKNTEKHHCHFKYRCRQIVSTGRLLASKEGREILGFYKDINNIYDQLLNGAARNTRVKLHFLHSSQSIEGWG